MNNNILYLTLLLLATACSIKPNSEKAQFSTAQQSLIEAGGPTDPMRVWKITNYTDSLLLRKQSEIVIPDPDDPVLKRFTERLYATVRDSASRGVGIAAPQVGILKRIIWVQRFDKPNFPFEVYLNPEITEYSEKTITCREGCLSIPNRSDTLNSRAYSIKIEYDRMDGTHIQEQVDDFTAVVFQHEIDHLNGIIYLDHLAKEIEESGKAVVDPKQILREAIQDEFPGVEAAVAMIRGGDVQFYGVRKTTDSIEWLDNRDAVFEIGSISKVFTGLLYAEAMDRGLVRADDQLQTHLPVPFRLTDAITLDHLVTHTSGLPRVPSQVFFASIRNEPNPYAGFDETELHKWLTDYAVSNNAPGEKFEYSNLGMGLLGYAVTERTQKSYGALLDEWVFEPYKMTNSTLDTATISNRYVSGITSEGQPGVHWNLEMLSPAGGVLSTAEDLSRFALAHLSDNELLTATRAPRHRVNDNMEIGTAWVILHDKGRHPWYWHNGATGGYNASLILIPAEQHAVVVLLNREPNGAGEGLADKVAFGLLK